MRNTTTLALALVFSMLFATVNCAWAVPITGNTGPGGFEKTDDALSNLRLWLDAGQGVYQDVAGTMEATTTARPGMEARLRGIEAYSTVSISV